MMVHKVLSVQAAVPVFLQVSVDKEDVLFCDNPDFFSNFFTDRTLQLFITYGAFDFIVAKGDYW